MLRSNFLFFRECFISEDGNDIRSAAERLLAAYDKENLANAKVSARQQSVYEGP